MALNVTVLGQASGTNVTSLSITTSGVSVAGGQIFVGLGINLDGFDLLSDSAGNVYDEVVGSQSGVGGFLFNKFNNARLPNNGTITLSNPDPFTAHMGAFYISGLTSGVVDAVSAGQNVDDRPLVALDRIPANDYVICSVTVADGSSNTFTQDLAFTSPGTFNTQTTTGLSVYAGYRQVTAGGTQLYHPSLLRPATWAAFMAAIRP